MNKPDEYRQEAVASLKLEAASNQSGKMRMLLMADAWLSWHRFTLPIARKCAHD